MILSTNGFERSWSSEDHTDFQNRSSTIRIPGRLVGDSEALPSDLEREHAGSTISTQQSNLGKVKDGDEEGNGISSPESILDEIVSFFRKLFKIKEKSKTREVFKLKDESGVEESVRTGSPESESVVKTYHVKMALQQLQEKLQLPSGGVNLDEIARSSDWGATSSSKLPKPLLEQISEDGSQAGDDDEEDFYAWDKRKIFAGQHSK